MQFCRIIGDFVKLDVGGQNSIWKCVFVYNACFLGKERELNAIILLILGYQNFSHFPSLYNLNAEFLWLVGQYVETIQLISLMR